MALDIQNLITPEIREKLSKKDLAVLDESVNKAYNEKISEIEKQTSDKFNMLVESLTKKFDEQVNKTIVESVKDNVGNTVNAKLYKIIYEMVNLLENSGISTTERTKELQSKLRLADDNLQSAYRERQEIKKQLTDAEKENFILSRLKGMKPEIVNSALEYFRDKDILDVQDEIDAFLDGDFSSLIIDNNREEFAGDINLDQVRDALKDMDNQPRGSGVVNVNGPAPKFEGLSKGLRPQRLVGSRRAPNVTNEILEESVETPRALMEVEEDTQIALTQIHDFNNLGYRFR
jgi:hypothetical protein